MNKLNTSYALIILICLFQISTVLAIDLVVKEKEVSSLAIIELNEPAIFELEITNNESISDSFEIYSFVGRIDLEPTESFTINSNSTRTILLEAYPRNMPGFFSFEYAM